MGLWKLLAIFLCLFVGVDVKPPRDPKFCNAPGTTKPGFNFHNQSCYYLTRDNKPSEPKTPAPGCHDVVPMWDSSPTIQSAEEDYFLGSIVLDGPNENRKISLDMLFGAKGLWRDKSQAKYWAEWGNQKPNPRHDWILVGNYSRRNGTVHSNWYFADFGWRGLVAFELIINASCQWRESFSDCFYDDGWCYRNRSITVLADRIISAYCSGAACPKNTTEICPKGDPCWLITTATTSFCPFTAYSSPVIIAAAYGFYVFCANNLI